MDVNPLLILANDLKKINGNSDFAAAVALTRTAQIVQKDVKEDIKRKFTLRNTWTERGIRIIPARKDKLESQVYSKDWYLPDQDEGGRRQPKEQGFFLPGEDFYRVTGQDKTKVIKKKLRGSKIVGQKLNGKKVFRGTFKSGARFIAVRKPEGTYNPEKERNFDILYVMIDKDVNIRGRKFFKDVASDAYDKHFQEEYDKAWNEFILKGI